MAEEDKRLCQQCEFILRAEEFPTNPRLYGGRGPWCEMCLGLVRDMPPSPERKAHVEKYQAEYRRLYQRAARLVKRGPRREKMKIVVAGVRASVTMIHRAGKVRLEGPWRILDAMIDVLRDELGCDPSNIQERGLGAGSGRRRQKKAMVECEVTREAWEEFKRTTAETVRKDGAG